MGAIPPWPATRDPAEQARRDRVLRRWHFEAMAVGLGAVIMVPVTVALAVWGWLQ